MLCCQQGRLAEGIDVLRKATAVAPRRASAHNHLGMAHYQLGQLDAAIASLDLAVACEPGLADAHDNRGAVLLDLRRHAEAIESCDRALALAPDAVTAWCTRGAALGEMGRHEEAIASYDRALAHDPRLAAAHFNRGLCMAKLKRYVEALDAFTQALAIDPRMVQALNDQVNVLRELGRLEEALASCDRAIALNPAYAEAFYLRGNTLAAMKQYEDALASYDRATALKPSYAEAFQNRGYALGALVRLEEALASFDRAIALRPDHAEFVCDRARALHDSKRFEEALACYGRAIALNPKYAEAYYYRGHAFGALQRYEEALASYEQAIALDLDQMKHLPDGRLHAKMQLCNWERLDQDCLQLISAIGNGDLVVDPFALLPIRSTPAQQLTCAKAYAGARRTAAAKLWRGECYQHDRIRIAYLSSDLRNHAVGFLTVGLFEQHDRSRIETIALSTGPDDDSDTRRRIKAAVDQFHDVRSRTDPEIAQLIRDLEVDIAVDLNGLTQGARLNILARRPAPIQVNYLGYPGTMGADYIDYIIADRMIIPADQRQFYSENVVYLPDTYQANDDKRPVSDVVPSRLQAGLPEGKFVFCSFNNAFKFNPPVFDVWMRLLRQVEGSVLWLLEGTARVSDNLRMEAERRGVAANRLVFAPRKRLEDHLARHRLADLFLDTLPYNAHTTASDALWAGLPVLTCLGSTFSGRVAGSLLSAVGLSELITNSFDEYEALALRLAHDPDLLGSIRAKLLRNRGTSALGNTSRFARQIEAAYTTMRDICRRGDPPRSFDVPQLANVR